MGKKVLLQDLVEGLARRMGLPKKDADVFIRSIFEIIEESLHSDKIVKIKGLGTFKLVTVDSRESVDVNTGERIVIKEYTKINFIPDAQLREAVNKPFAQFDTVVLYEGTDIAEMERLDEIDLSDEKEEAELPESAEEEEVLEETESIYHESAIITAAAGEDEPDNESEPDSEPVETPEQEEPANEEMAAETDSDEEIVIEIEEPEEQETPNTENSSVQGEIPAPSENPVEQIREEQADVHEQAENNEKAEEVQHEKRIHVSSQQIEVQKVEHQTVENQHIVHLSPESNRRRVYLTPWMTFFLVLLVLFLMGISYYIGYNQLFIKTKPTKQDTVVATKIQPVVKKDTVPDVAVENKDSIEVPKDSLSLLSASEVIKTEREKKETEVLSDIQQVKGGKYEIIGTKEEHRLRSGETLRGLALKYYGSKDFTIYLVTYNKIKNPDIVPEGMLIKIPEVKLKQ